MAAQDRDKIFELVELKRCPKAQSSVENLSSDDSRDPPSCHREDQPEKESAGSKDKLFQITPSQNPYQGLVKHNVNNNEVYQNVNLSSSVGKSGKFSIEETEDLKGNDKTEDAVTEAQGQNNLCVMTKSMKIAVIAILAAVLLFVVCVILSALILAIVNRTMLDDQESLTSDQLLNITEELHLVYQAVLQVSDKHSALRREVEMMNTSIAELYSMHSALSLKVAQNLDSSRQMISSVNSTLSNRLQSVSLEVTDEIESNRMSIEANMHSLSSLNASLLAEVGRIQTDLALKMNLIDRIQLNLNATTDRISQLSMFNILANCTAFVEEELVIFNNSSMPQETSVSANITVSDFNL